MPTYRIITLGCKVNRYESLQIEELLRKRGYTLAQGDEADVVVVNTCSVTASAAAKSRNLLRRHARRPGGTGEIPRTIAVGCWATSDRAEAAEIVGAAGVIGHGAQLQGRLGELLPVSRYEPIETAGALGPLPILQNRQPSNQRAILKVQDGCDAHCTYCIIPKLRPILWSRPADEVVREAAGMVAAGHLEIVLTGVFLGAYGQTTALHRRQTKDSGLAELVERLCTEVPGMLRLRLSSLEPGDVTGELVATLRKWPQIMPHFHLPLQSGSDAVLRKMNRQYSAGDFRRMVERLKEAFDRPALTTDVIVGFPGESEEDFRATLEMAQLAGFLHVHAFPYSPRQGTAAARWTDQMVTQRVVTERMAELQELSCEMSVQYRSGFIGQTVELLVERESAVDQTDAVEPDGSGVRHGRCERYFAVHFETASELTGRRVRARIERVTKSRTIGVICSP